MLTNENKTVTGASTSTTRTHVYTDCLPISHTFVWEKMCLAGKELFSVNSYNSSSQTWVLGRAARIPLWAANYCERSDENSTFHTVLIQRGSLLAQLPHNSLLCHDLLHKISSWSFSTSTLVISWKKILRWARKGKQRDQPWYILDLHIGWWVFFLQWCDWRFWGSYKLLLEQSWIPTQACGIQPGTLSVSGFNTAVWVPSASQIRHVNTIYVDL